MGSTSAIGGKLKMRRMQMKNLSKVFLLTIIMIMGSLLFAGLAAGEVKLLKGQTCYVPCPTSFIAGTYSFDLRATVFIHNTDKNNAINIIGIDFYDSSGKLVAKYLQQPLRLNPFAATRINVKAPLAGEDGMAAHFIVQWQSENKVAEPLMQGLFFGSSGTRGYSFTLQPRIIQEDAN
jgi:hypothetical protein